MDDEHRMSTTVLKAFKILDLIASKNDSASLAVVADELEFSKSTAHRYLVTLEKLGVVTRDNSDRFSLGPKLAELAGAFFEGHSLRSVSQAFLEQLAAQTRETLHLAVPSGNEVVYIAKVASSHSIRMASRIGGRMPLHCTALGKAILAHSNAPIEEIVGEELVARTPSTIKSLEALSAELDRVRSLGFAIDDEENEMGVRCVGAPVLDHTSKPCGAISISGPAARISKEQLVEWGPLVRDAALDISSIMGYRHQKVSS